MMPADPWCLNGRWYIDNENGSITCIHPKPNYPATYNFTTNQWVPNVEKIVKGKTS